MIERTGAVVGRRGQHLRLRLRLRLGLRLGLGLGLGLALMSGLTACGPTHPAEGPWPVNEYCQGLEQWTPKWEAYEWAVLERVNEIRAAGTKCGDLELPAVPPLEMDARLHCAARAHARDMADEDYVSHVNGLGESPAERMKLAGYRYRSAGENIAVTTHPVVYLPPVVELALMGPLMAARPHPDPEHVVEVWLESPSHCANLMSPRYADAGIGFVLGPGGAPIWTQSMGYPREIPIL